jgi:hypothetical protein
MRVALAPLLLVASAFADSVTYNVSLDTSPLVSSLASPFWLEFQLNDGSGTGDGNNTAVLNDFNFGTGSPGGSPFDIGGVSGDLSSSVSLVDNSAFGSAFVEMFQPGNSLSFQLQLSTNVDSGGNPDTFLFSILDSSFTPIPTTAGFPIDVLASIEINNAISPTVQTFSGDTSRTPDVGGPIGIAAPIVSDASVPEPSALPLLSVALAAFAWKRRANR